MGWGGVGGDRLDHKCALLTDGQTSFSVRWYLNPAQLLPPPAAFHLYEFKFTFHITAFFTHLLPPPLLFFPITFIPSFPTRLPPPPTTTPTHHALYRFLKNDWSPLLNPPIQRLISDSISVIDRCPPVLYHPPPLSWLTDRFPFHKWNS